MVHAIFAPRVNNNDDEVQLVALGVAVGQRVAAGQVVATVETAKAAVDVEAEAAGHVLRIEAELSDQVAVGSPLIWIGDSPDDRPPAREEKKAAAPVAGRVTAKAAILLRRHGLDAADVPSAGDRLTAADVEAYLANKPAAAKGNERGGERAGSAGSGAAGSGAAGPGAAGRVRTMNAAEKGMLATVTWHRDEAVPGYIEFEADPREWNEFADAYAKQHGLMTSPLLGLLAGRLASLARETPRINSTIHGGGVYEYDSVNLGFTVQVQDTLYLAVLREAEKLDTGGFLLRLGELQRKAFARKLSAEETLGATVAFSSMARWAIARHIPILPPFTSLIVAHAAPSPDRLVLGASYDHRVLSGADVTKILRALSKPKG
jgi:pyruvate/2-oxoglutarate dehydrogenase complex dihydrolipoamide acyltransferase (E2) component